MKKPSYFTKKYIFALLLIFFFNKITPRRSACIPPNFRINSTKCNFLILPNVVISKLVSIYTVSKSYQNYFKKSICV